MNNARLHTAMVKRSEAQAAVFEEGAIVTQKINWKLRKTGEYL